MKRQKWLLTLGDWRDTVLEILILISVLSYLRSHEGDGNKPRKTFERKLNLSKEEYGANLQGCVAR